MLRYFLILSLLPLLPGGYPTLAAQTTLQGRIVDQKGKPVAFANVFLDEIFDGTASDENGYFSFATEERDSAWLVVKSIGFDNYRERVILSGDTINIDLQLQPASATLSQAVITAGAFEAGDEKKAALLKPLDIVTNAGSQGDVYGALSTLPGVSRVGDETGIFVRGGEAYETRTFINGTLVQRPFFSSVPNIPGRGRFDPFMFKGTLFATGGYSAEYGQALSSVVLLETQDLPDKTSTGFSLNMAGVGLSHTHLWNKKTALLTSVGYTNLLPLMSIVPQNRDWETPPTGGEGSLGVLHKTKQGTFKTYLQYQQGRIGMRFPSLEQGESPADFTNRNRNLFFNSSYQGILKDKWSLYGGVAVGWDTDQTDLGENQFGFDGLLAQGKMTLGRDIGRVLYLKFGGEVHLLDESHRRNELKGLVSGLYTGIFAEAELSLGKRWAIRLGLRGEYDQIVNNANLAPRTSLAYKTGENSQVSFAYGHFYQRPESEFLRTGQDLDFERSSHLLLNYQWMNDFYTFRIEGYWKPYQNLVRMDSIGNLNNLGEGHARGIDLFWRDKKTIKGLDYWVTYSFLDAKRFYRDFPNSATPDFVTPHTLNIVANYRLRQLPLRLGMAYTFASGRTYYNPNNPIFLDDTTPNFHNLNLNLSYLTHIGGNFTVLYFSLRNPFGFQQIFSYQYSQDGTIRAPTIPASTWSFFMGIFISFE